MTSRQPLQVKPLTHFCPPLRFRNQFLPTVPTFAVRETDVSRHNGGTSGAPLKPHRDDSALRALSSLRGLRGALEVSPHYAERRQSLGQQMLERWTKNGCETETVGKNVLISRKTKTTKQINNVAGEH